MLGIWQRRRVSSCSAVSFLFSSSLLVSLRAATFVLTSSASSRLPCFMSMPISAANFLAFERFWSSSVCAARRLLSTAITSSIALRASAKCFFSSPAMTRSVSSVMSFSVSIYCIYFLTIYYLKGEPDECGCVPKCVTNDDCSQLIGHKPIESAPYYAANKGCHDEHEVA